MSFMFFFFKQKTAYEMRISDWSSDVCSSDLAGLISYWLEPDPLWLVGAALIVANWPFTFAAIMPITRRLTATAIDSSGAGERRAIERWGRLHAVRTGLGLASLAAYVAATA